MLSFLQKKGNSKKTDSTLEKENLNLVQKCSIFDELTINIGECQNYLVALLTAILNGQKFSEEDIRTIFFTITKAYDNKDIILHRYLLLVLRYLDVPEEYAFMITQSVIKDISSNINDRKSFAVRLVPHIVTPNNKHLTDIDRYIKEIIISQHQYLSICGLSSVLSLCFKGFSNEVQKWITEISSASNTCNSIQHYGLLVLYYLRRGDGNILQKMASQTKERVSGSYMTDHISSQICSEAYKYKDCRPAYEYLSLKLQSSRPVTQIDAARAILGNEKSPEDLVLQAIERLNTMLMSCTYSMTKFAILRTISEHASKHRKEFSKCNSSLERLLSDRDSNISTLAAISLLHTGLESAIGQVLPVVSLFSSKLSSEQQTSILKSCAEFAKLHPSKLEFILNFMWNTFRQIDLYEVQLQLVESFMNFVDIAQNSSTVIFKYLCEYLEDSKFTRITILIIHFIGEKGPAQDNRTELVRCLCNRLYLETAEIRASTIDSLSKFFECEDIRNSVLHVIKKYLNDSDDEVRERAVFYNCCFEKQYSSLLNIVPPQLVSEVVEEKPVVVIKETPLSVYGQPLYETKEVSLTHPDDEIVVSYVVHVYLSVIAVEFIVNNTLGDAITDVEPILDQEIKQEYIELEKVISCSEIETQSSVYAIFKRTQQINDKNDLCNNLALGRYNFSIFLFTPEQTEYTYSLDKEITLMANIYMKPINIGNFESTFMSLSEESPNTFTFQNSSVDDVISLVCESTGLAVLSKNKGKQKNVEFFDVQLGGLFMDKEIVLGKLRLMQRRKDVNAHFVVRSNDGKLLQLIFDSYL